MPTTFEANIKTKYTDDGLKVFRVSHYHANNSPALQIYSEEGEPLLTASVCTDRAPKANHIIIKDWSENEGIEDALIVTNLIKSELSSHHPCGFCIAGEFEMIGDLLKAWQAHQKEMGWDKDA